MRGGGLFETEREVGRGEMRLFKFDDDGGGGACPRFRASRGGTKEFEDKDEKAFIVGL